LELVEPSDPYATVRDRNELDRALARLDADQRLLVALRFYEDLSVDQIAAKTGWRAGTVKSRLHHAVRRLGALLGDSAAEGSSR
jgi:RNA polymerase sigma factor (sigma-70 family)